MAKSLNLVTGYENEARWSVKFDSSNGVLTVHEQLRWFNNVLVHKDELKKKTTDEQLNDVYHGVISKRKKQTSQPFNSYNCLTERGFKVQDAKNIIALNGIVLNYMMEKNNEVVLFNDSLYPANQKNSALLFRIAQLCGQLKN